MVAHLRFLIHALSLPPLPPLPTLPLLLLLLFLLLLVLQVPSLAFVPAKFASTNRMEVEALRNTIVRTIARAKRATMQQSQW